MAVRGSPIAVTAVLILLALVLAPAIPAEATRRMAQEYIPRRPPIFCPACVCCTPKPVNGCCSCCASPIDPSPAKAKP
ncbi:unnamed protein product [Spirodela intermedia]|uniref:Uncharacterized protein n=1 Tax=Spirodela intermedia TaxID=51605 RepID=A0A7I8KLQ1_SPIIN|nr:unnamed protein product [Spirodela intermedia]